MAKEKVIILKVDSKQAVDGIENVTDELDVANEKTSDLSGGLLDAAMNFKIMGVSIKSVIASLKALRVSLIATGIGAIAVAVGTLAAAFLDTQKGANTVTRVLTPLKEIMATLWGVVQNLGLGFARILNGEFTEGWNDMTKAVDGLGASMAVAVQRGQEMAEIMIFLEKTEGANILTLSRLNRQRQEYRATVDDETRSDKERQEALTNLTAVNDAIFKIKEARLKAEIKLIEQGREANDNAYESDLELAQKQAEIEDAAALREKQRKDEFAIARRISEETDIRDKVNPLNGLTTNELADILGEQEVVLGSFSELQQGFADSQVRRAKEQADAEKRIDDAKFAAKQKMFRSIAQGAAALSDILGRQTAEGKALAVASSLINTYAAISGQLRAFSGVPIPGFAIAQAIATGLVGFAAVRNILQTNVPGGYGGNASQPGTVTSGAAGAGGQPPSFNIVGTSATNQLADVINDRDSQPVKAYVVGSEVSTQQALDRNTIENATVI